MGSRTEPEKLAADAFVARADDLPVAERRTQSEQLADGNHEPQITHVRPRLDRERDVDAISRAAARWKRGTQTEADGGSPTRIKPVRRITGPHPSDIDEQRAAQVHGLTPGPAPIHAVLEGKYSPPSSGESVGVITTQRAIAAQRELERSARIPAGR